LCAKLLFEDGGGLFEDGGRKTVVRGGRWQNEQ
jgi:hypothetical protein